MTQKQLQKFYDMAEPRSENAIRKAEARKKIRELMPTHEEVLTKLDKDLCKIKTINAVLCLLGFGIVILIIILLL